LGKREMKEEIKKETLTCDKSSINHRYTSHQEKGDAVTLSGTRLKSKFRKPMVSHAPPFFICFHHITKCPFLAFC